MSDQILLPAVEGAMRRIAVALGRLGPNADHVDGELAICACTTDESIRAGGDRFDCDVIEWILVAEDPATTVARMAVCIADWALTSVPPAGMDPGTATARVALGLALECGVIAHRHDGGEAS